MVKAKKEAWPRMGRSSSLPTNYLGIHEDQCWQERTDNQVGQVPTVVAAGGAPLSLQSKTMKEVVQPSFTHTEPPSWLWATWTQNLHYSKTMKEVVQPSFTHTDPPSWLWATWTQNLHYSSGQPRAYLHQVRDYAYGNRITRGIFSHSFSTLPTFRTTTTVNIKETRVPLVSDTDGTYRLPHSDLGLSNPYGSIKRQNPPCWRSATREVPEHGLNFVGKEKINMGIEEYPIFVKSS
jgi:hypothetical protein